MSSHYAHNAIDRLAAELETSEEKNESDILPFVDACRFAFSRLRRAYQAKAVKAAREGTPCILPQWVTNHKVELTDSDEVTSDIVYQAYELTQRSRRSMDIRLAICYAARYYVKGRRFVRSIERSKSPLTTALSQLDSMSVRGVSLTGLDEEGNALPLEGGIVQFTPAPLQWEPYPYTELLEDLLAAGFSESRLTIVCGLARGSKTHWALTDAGYSIKSKKIVAKTLSSLRRSQIVWRFMACRTARRMFTPVEPVESNPPYVSDEVATLAKFVDNAPKRLPLICIDESLTGTPSLLTRLASPFAYLQQACNDDTSDMVSSGKPAAYRWGLAERKKEHTLKVGYLTEDVLKLDEKLVKLAKRMRSLSRDIKQLERIDESSGLSWQETELLADLITKIERLGSRRKLLKEQKAECEFAIHREKLAYAKWVSHHKAGRVTLGKREQVATASDMASELDKPAVDMAAMNNAARLQRLAGYTAGKHTPMGNRAADTGR